MAIWWIAGIDTGISATGSTSAPPAPMEVPERTGKTGRMAPTALLPSLAATATGGSATPTPAFLHGGRRPGWSGRPEWCGHCRRKDQRQRQRLIVTLTDGTELNAGVVWTEEIAAAMDQGDIASLRTMVYVALAMAGVSLGRPGCNAGVPAGQA